MHPEEPAQLTRGRVGIHAPGGEVLAAVQHHVPAGGGGVRANSGMELVWHVACGMAYGTRHGVAWGVTQSPSALCSSRNCQVWCTVVRYTIVYHSIDITTHRCHRGEARSQQPSHNLLPPRRPWEQSSHTNCTEETGSLSGLGLGGELRLGFGQSQDGLRLLVMAPHDAPP